MNYEVKYEWNKGKSCFVYAESQPNSCGSDMFVYFPLVAGRQRRAGVPPYETASA
jgi:hypothetical protein